MKVYRDSLLKTIATLVVTGILRRGTTQVILDWYVGCMSYIRFFQSAQGGDSWEPLISSGQISGPTENTTEQAPKWW